MRWLIILLLAGCVTTTQAIRQTEEEFKPAIYQCEGRWYDIVVPTCLPDNLANGTPVMPPDEDQLYLIRYTVPGDEPALIVFDWTPGVCGPEYIIAATCGGQAWTHGDGTWRPVEREAIGPYLRDYRGDEAEGDFRL